MIEMKKVKFIALAVVLMLGLIGGAYAGWSESFEISADVQAADWEVVFDNLDSPDESENPHDLAELEVTEPDDQTISINVDNAFPGYEVTGTVDLKNYSSIPVIVENQVVEPAIEEYNLQVSFSNYPEDGVELDAGERYEDIEFTILMPADASESAAGDSYSRTLTFDVVQNTD